MLYDRRIFRERNFGWYMNDRTIQLYVCKPVPEHLDAVIYLEENEKENGKLSAEAANLIPGTKCA